MAKRKTTTKKTTAKRTTTRKAAPRKQAEPTGLYTAGFVLGIIGVVFAFIPFCYGVAYILGGLALVFGIVGLVRKHNGYQAIAATILGAIAIVAGIAMNVRTVHVVNEVVDDWTESLNEALEDFDYASDIVGTYADVEFLGYQEVVDDWDDHALLVKVTNITDQTRSFALYIEALDENGDRMDESYVNASELAPGQSATLKAFTLTNLSDEQMQNATFNIYQSSTY